jgi:hypothetical protein
MQGGDGKVGGVDVWSLRCECGATITAATEDELVLAADRHVAEEHPRLRGAAPRQYWLAMASREQGDEASSGGSC